MKVLVLGAGGQIGREVCRAAWPPRYAVLPRDQDEVDITKSAAVTATLARERRDRSVRDGVPNSAAIPLPTAFFGAKFPLPENTAKSCQDIDNTVFFASGGDSPGAEMRFFRCRQRKKEPARPPCGPQPAKCRPGRSHAAAHPCPRSPGARPARRSRNAGRSSAHRARVPEMVTVPQPPRPS